MENIYEITIYNLPFSYYSKLDMNKLKKFLEKDYKIKNIIVDAGLYIIVENVILDENFKEKIFFYLEELSLEYSKLHNVKVYHNILISNLKEKKYDFELIDPNKFQLTKQIKN